MRILGIDYGEKRVGLALSDETGSIAFPLAVIENNSMLLDTVRDVCEKEIVESVVMGESKNFAQKDNPIAEDARQFAEKIIRELKLNVYFEPEFLTSVEAERIQGKNALHDASAAALILKSFLDRKKNHDNN